MKLNTYTSQNGGIRLGLALVFAIGMLPAMLVLGVASFFFLGSDARTLRNAVLSSAPGAYHQKIAVNVGPITTSLVRIGSGMFNLPKEARLAIASAQGAQVGIYELRGDSSRIDREAVLQRADKGMTRQGWERIVGVCDREDLVAIYIPKKGVSAAHVRCSVLVLSRDQFIVVSGRANAKPLMTLAQLHMDEVPIGKNWKKQASHELISWAPAKP